MKCNVYEEALIILDDFVKNKISNYSKLRNYDYGLANPIKGVSGLSHFISKGIIKEYFILNYIKKNKVSSEKYVQEILWRTYWKGWLESHKEVWDKYKNNLFEQLENITTSEQYDLYDKAITGKTKIEPFDYWIEQLKSTGYLHNHARMWFSSIWIHNFALPWELGAKLFYDHLLDADIASNTLSWRWVAGIQTIGKKYLAKKDNINKYTFNRFNDFKLPSVKNISFEEAGNISNSIDYNNSNKLDENEKNIIIVFENNLSFDFIKNNKKNILLIIFIRIQSELINKSTITRNFQKRCNNDFLELCKKNNIIVKEFEINKNCTNLISFIKSKKIKKVYSEYVPLGFEKDIMNEVRLALNKHNISYLEILEEFYKASWVYCNKGFFNFKKNFDKLLKIF